MKYSEDKYNKLKDEAELIYKGIGQVKCPYLSDFVHFNAKGLEHLKFKQKNKARSSEDQYVRFKLLNLAPKVIEVSKTVQGISEQKVFENQRSNGRTEVKLVNVIYHEFIAILEGVRVRVVVKRIECGPHYFWSIIPFWKNQSTHGKRFHYGNSECD